MRRAIAVAALGVLLDAGRTLAQDAGQASVPPALTLEQALRYALDHYPSVKVAVEQSQMSAAGVDVARSAYLPRLESVWQSNRATANNIFGQLLPQSVLPAISGPVLPSASGDSVWGSAVGTLMTWEALDFGLRSATVAGAEAALARARADETVTRIDVQSAVANAYLAVVAAEQAVSAARADVERRDLLARAARVLVDNQLRPGVEASRADAERAAAQTRLIQARQALILTQTTLSRVLGVTSGVVTIDAANLLAGVPEANAPPAAASAHPFARAREAAVGAARAQEQVLDRANLPRVFLQSSVFARGSGAQPSGELRGSFDGLGLDRANWAAGIQIVVPNLFEFASLRARKAASAAATRAESARYDEAVLLVTSQQQAAAAMVQAAREIASNTPVQVTAARETEAQARARYQAGLASIVEVADAQGLLAQAETQDQLARVDVWRALLADAVARGDVESFAALLRSSSGAR